MRKTAPSVVLIFLLSLLISCKSTKAVSSLRPVYITNTKKVNLLGPSAAVGVFEGIQLLNGSFGDTGFSLMSYTQIDATGISLSLMNDFGTDMGNVFYDGTKVIFDSAYFPKALPGEYIICDIQNAYYDKAAVQEIRCISDGKKLIEEITILENTITIKNYLRGYEYNLTKLEE